MTKQTASFSLSVDLTNSGQFFACCGLLELAHRLWPGAVGVFDGDKFRVHCDGVATQMVDLLESLKKATLRNDEEGGDPKTAPIRLLSPFDLRLDWWRDESGGERLKTWAGQQSAMRIACAMKGAIPCNEEQDLLDRGRVVYDPDDGKKAVEPFYFDARRFADSLNTGFSLDAHGAETIAHPAVEFLCLIGLQRFRPAPTEDKWSFVYSPWSTPLPATVASVAVCGAIPSGRRYLFNLRFRDDQKRYKAFSFAHIIGD